MKPYYWFFNIISFLFVLFATKFSSSVFCKVESKITNKAMWKKYFNILKVSHSSGVVVSLQSKLASMTNDFKRVLEVRTENLKESKSRQEKFTHGAITPTNLPIAVTNGYHKGSVLALAAMEDDMAVSQVRNSCEFLGLTEQ